jgi:hypothetical protein
MSYSIDILLKQKILLEDEMRFAEAEIVELESRIEELTAGRR